MMIEYKHPRVFSDGADIGDIVSALINNPKLETQILAAHDVAWGNRQGEADSAQLEQLQRAADLQIEQMRSQLAAKAAELAALRLETAPDLQAIAPALQAAGLTAWADRAITAADPDKGVLDLVLQLYGAAKEPRSLDQCDRVKALFVAIGELSNVWPTPEEAWAMQAILTANSVGEKWLKFA